jgi:hypothetical protein
MIAKNRIVAILSAVHENERPGHNDLLTCQYSRQGTLYD